MPGILQFRRGVYREVTFVHSRGPAHVRLHRSRHDPEVGLVLVNQRRDR
jgi:hypothetical protein